jgi:acyl carrier protein
MNIEKKVLEIIASALRLNPDQLRPEAHLKEDLGASSLDRYTILVDIEDAFGITLDDVPEDELEQKVATVRAIIAFLSERVKG